MISAPFHAGERALQAQTGWRDRMEAVGPRVIRDYMPDQHREFFAQLPFLVVGSLDASLQPWASVLAAPAELSPPTSSMSKSIRIPVK